jgi:hypothetical protein
LNLAATNIRYKSPIHRDELSTVRDENVRLIMKHTAYPDLELGLKYRLRDIYKPPPYRLIGYSVVDAIKSDDGQGRSTMLDPIWTNRCPPNTAAQVNLGAMVIDSGHE